MVKPSAHASHILVASKSEAVQISEKIGKLKDFEKLARKKSTCPSSQRGGYISVGSEKETWFAQFGGGSMEHASQNGFNTGQTQFGYHLIWVHERDEE